MSKQVWKPLPNGHNTGRIGNYEIQIGLDSGKLHIFNIRKNRECWTLDLPKELAMCQLSGDDDESDVTV